MNESREFLLAEIDQIGKTLDLLIPLLDKAELNPYEVIALGTLLQNIYTGVESMLRCQLQALGHKLVKTENWHKELLRAALDKALITEQEWPALSSLLLYRHRHIHGYGHMLEETRLRELAAPTPQVIRAYLQRVKDALA